MRDILRRPDAIQVAILPANRNEGDNRKKILRGILLCFNTLTLVISLLKLFLSLYVMYWTILYWWGLSSLLLSIFAALVAIIYYPLIWNSVKLDAVKIVLICMTISHVVAGGLSIYKVLKTQQDGHAHQNSWYTTTQALNLGVIFLSFTYYWRLYNQQNEQYLGPAYDPSRDLSPNLPSCEPQIKGEPPGDTQGTATGTQDNNNHSEKMHQSCASDTCRPQPSRPNSCRSTPSAPSRPSQSVTPPELRRPGSSFDHHIPKIEPDTTPSTPPTPPSSCADEIGVAICAGCGIKITDRYFLQAVERRWHAQCLQCCQCRHTLDGDITCFSRDGNIYCKKDYYRLFGMKRCARCQATILSSELVMRARDLVFHVHCFSCEVCSSPLTKGDHFGMRGCSVLCRLHFEMPPDMPHTGMFPMHSFPGKSDVYMPPFPSPEFHPSLPPQVPPPPVEPPVGKPPFFNGQTGAPPRQKGRPRKRKPKDLEGMTAGLDLSQEYLDIPFGRSPGTPGMHGSNQRTKRMRTSFKHHQLRTMKSYFAINHNPDAKDLKQLSQKTGLPKRVLQVWFQNARAKWRRMMLKQEGKTGEKCSGSESMSDMDIYGGPGGPASMGSSIGMAPHSPPFLLPSGGGSPSSLDCS